MILTEGGDRAEACSSGRYVISRSDWSTLEISAGDTESLTSLRGNMQFCFSATEHNVKVVLLVKFDRERRKIILEQFQETVSHFRTAGEPLRCQKTTIGRDQTANAATYSVDGGPLAMGSLSGGLSIDTQDLHRYAERALD